MLMIFLNFQKTLQTFSTFYLKLISQKENFSHLKPNWVKKLFRVIVKQHFSSSHLPSSCNSSITFKWTTRWSERQVRFCVEHEGSEEKIALLKGWKNAGRDENSLSVVKRGMLNPISTFSIALKNVFLSVSLILEGIWD